MEQTKEKSAMKNEPKVIYLNCYDEAETDESYFPIDNDFDSLDGENVLWSSDHPCLGGHIKYFHSDIVIALESKLSYQSKVIAELEGREAKYREVIEELMRPKLSADINESTEQWNDILLKAEQALKEKP